MNGKLKEMKSIFKFIWPRFNRFNRRCGVKIFGLSDFPWNLNRISASKHSSVRLLDQLKVLKSEAQIIDENTLSPGNDSSQN